MRLPSIACLALAAAAATPAHSQGFESLDGVERQVAMFVGADPANPASAVIPVDRRLRLAACGAALDLSYQGNRQESVLVRCPGPDGWKVYVRLLNAAPGIAATPAIMRGDSVTVTLSGPGFSVSQAAEAMDAGAVGEWVRVRVGKGNEMRAQVLRPGVVGMNLP